MRKKVLEWIWRYGPAELISLPATYFPALLVLNSTHDALAAAVAGTWGGNIGYFGTILIRDVWVTRKKLHSEGRAYDIKSFGKNVRALVVEFGVAEALDTLLIRPALMYYLPRVFASFATGIIVAKFVADLTFYLPAIIFYEMSKRRFREF